MQAGRRSGVCWGGGGRAWAFIAWSTDRRRAPLGWARGAEAILLDWSCPLRRESQAPLYFQA